MTSSSSFTGAGKDDNATRASLSQYGRFGACKTGYGEGPWSNFTSGTEGEFVPGLLKSDFARPFAPAIAGNFSSAKPIDIDILREEFELTYMIDPTIQAPTELSLPAIRYPRGFTVEVTPRGVVAVEVVKNGARLSATAEARYGQEVTVTVRHKLL
jgi:hypothetical protein